MLHTLFDWLQWMQTFLPVSTEEKGEREERGRREGKERGGVSCDIILDEETTSTRDPIFPFPPPNAGFPHVLSETFVAIAWSPSTGVSPRVQPSNGSILFTDFELSAFGWQAEACDLPLTFR